jgi:calcineurin-like phosphoesterase family protein
MNLYDTWFTSDTHYFHKRIQEFCPDTRAGKDADEMTELMVQSWNGRVKPHDRVYHLGDVSFGSYAKTAQVLGRLNGNIELIMGNHDGKTLRSLSGYFASMKDYDHIKIGDQYLVLCHFPIENWREMRHGTIHLHGHLHGDTHHECRVLPNRLDVGVDTRKDRLMAPYHYDEVLEIVKNGGH